MRGIKRLILVFRTNQQLILVFRTNPPTLHHTSKNNCMMILSPNDVMKQGLLHVRVSYERQEDFSEAGREKLFRSHFGSTPLDLAEIWYDLTTTDIPGARIDEEDVSNNGFKMFAMAHFFLWTYPKNSYLLMSRFDICETYCRGKPLWNWIEKIALLKAKKIIWDVSLASPDREIFIASVDATDCKVNEPKHVTMNLDTRYCSPKMNHAALKYELIIAINQPKLLSIVGPKRAGEHDMTVFRSEVKEKMLQMPGKKLVGDSLYRAGAKAEHANEKGMMAPPSSTDPPELKHFKSRARCRHESFNGRIKHFQILSECFKNPLEKHVIAFTAVCVIVQYQMDNGSPIFSV
jgi:hypothetical protein